jgi:hypothetical protein
MISKLAFASLALATLVASGSAQAARQDFYLVNASGRTISAAHLSPASSSVIGPDVLGSYVLPSGGSTYVHFDRDAGACYWDLTVMFRGGGTSIDRHNLCRATSIIVH